MRNAVHLRLSFEYQEAGKLTNWISYNNLRPKFETYADKRCQTGHQLSKVDSRDYKVHPGRSFDRSTSIAERFMGYG